MRRIFEKAIALPFWASRNSSIFELMLLSQDLSAVRRASSLAPGFPREDPVEDPPARPVRPIPTDVPAPEPHDIPAHSPIDVPPPDPGKKVKPIKPLPPRPDPKPRPTP